MNVDGLARSSSRHGPSRRPARTVEGRPLRIGLVCPYSLSIPGGVQAQVLGLARVLRAMGHEARVLAPCDGPPPATYVTPLGNSIPTAANGSVAPIAPDPPAVLRTIRALRDEDFDVLHLHEPLAPGADHDHRAVPPGADRRHVPRRRRQQLVPDAERGGALAGRPHRGALRGVRRRGGARRPLPRRQLHDVVQRRRARDLSGRRTAEERRPDDLLLRSSRGAQGPRGPAAGAGRASRRRELLGGLRRSRDRALAARVRRRSPDRVARTHHRRREGRPAEGCHGVLRPVVALRVVRCRAARGDGGRHADRRHGAPRLPACRPAGRRRPDGAARRCHGARRCAAQRARRRGARRPPDAIGRSARRGVLDAGAGQPLRRDLRAARHRRLRPLGATAGPRPYDARAMASARRGVRRARRLAHGGTSS